MAYTIKAIAIPYSIFYNECQWGFRNFRSSPKTKIISCLGTNLGQNNTIKKTDIVGKFEWQVPEYNDSFQEKRYT